MKNTKNLQQQYTEITQLKQNGKTKQQKHILKEKQNVLIVSDKREYPNYNFNDCVIDNAFPNQNRHKGLVIKQDGQFVLVKWKDGSKQWHSANSLKKISDKEYKKQNESRSKF